MAKQVIIRYKTDHSSIPYCAYIENFNEAYYCEWSSESFETAKTRLLARLMKPTILVPPDEAIEIPE